MGKATRWLRGLLGMKKEKENLENSKPDERKVNKKWSFGKFVRNSWVVRKIALNTPKNIPVTNTAWLSSHTSETDEQQNRHAIAVAAATAAAADVAVAAAQAAAAVVRLTSQGRGSLFCGGRNNWAAVKIQAVFRGYLARKALRALKGLVKLQALFRGYIVRKRATAMLHGLQALIRAQATVQSQRTSHLIHKEHRSRPMFRTSRSMGRVDEIRGVFHKKRLSTTAEKLINAFEESPKIVEIDSYKPRSRSRSRSGRNIHSISDSGEELFSHDTLLSMSDCRDLPDSEWKLKGDECKFSTAQSTPRFPMSVRTKAPATPPQSVCDDGFSQPYSPNYMANTQSSSAKLRSHSAPKQRPEQGFHKVLSKSDIIEARTSLSGV